MADPEIDIQLVDRKTLSTATEVDYVPFGVKVLKLKVRKTAGPDLQVWIRTKCFKRDEDSCHIYGCADDSDDLWAVWGAGDIMGFCANYVDQGPNKVATILDDNAFHTIYLHLVHRPIHSENHKPKNRQLTIVAVVTDSSVKDLEKTNCWDRQYQDRIITEKTFTLTVPAGAQNSPIRPLWTWGPDGSDINFEGDEIPGYVSRWWPSRRVPYAKVDEQPQISLRYDRMTDPKSKEGAITAWLNNGAGRQEIARITGHLTLPLHDLRLLVPELYRFYDGRLFVLRLWFFWTSERIRSEDLLSFVPEPQRSDPGYQDKVEKEAAALMQSNLWGKWPGWDKQYEVPDAERFDIVFDPADLTVKYGCSDAHWQEFWSEVTQNKPFHGSIAAPKQAVKVLLDHALKQIRTFGQEPKPVTNPLEEGGIIARITKNRCHYNGQEIVCGQPFKPQGIRAPGLAGKNAPKIENGRLLPDGLSSDVLKG